MKKRTTVDQKRDKTEQMQKWVPERPRSRCQDASRNHDDRPSRFLKLTVADCKEITRLTPYRNSVLTSTPSQMRGQSPVAQTSTA